jgi:hypothetical protein
MRTREKGKVAQEEEEVVDEAPVAPVVVTVKKEPEGLTVVKTDKEPVPDMEEEQNKTETTKQVEANKAVLSTNDLANLVVKMKNRILSLEAIR